MSKARVTVTVDPHLLAYAERLVELGKVPSVSAAFNDALAARVERDQQARRWWEQKAAAAAADPEACARVDRWIAHIDSQRHELDQRGGQP